MTKNDDVRTAAGRALLGMWGPRDDMEGAAYAAFRDDVALVERQAASDLDPNIVARVLKDMIAGKDKPYQDALWWIVAKTFIEKYNELYKVENEEPSA